jgi:hypothetical protein
LARRKKCGDSGRQIKVDVTTSYDYVAIEQTNAAWRAEADARLSGVVEKASSSPGGICRRGRKFAKTGH